MYVVASCGRYSSVIVFENPSNRNEQVLFVTNTFNFSCFDEVSERPALSTYRILEFFQLSLGSFCIKAEHKTNGTIEYFWTHSQDSRFSVDVNFIPTTDASNDRGTNDQNAYGKLVFPVEPDQNEYIATISDCWNLPFTYIIVNSVTQTSKRITMTSSTSHSVMNVNGILRVTIIWEIPSIYCLFHLLTNFMA